MGKATIKDDDFSSPVNWLRSWESYWYFIKRLYGDECHPEKIKDISADNFRFNLKQNRGTEKGRVSATNFNNYKVGKVTKEEIERINKIIREEVMTRKK